MKALKPTYFDQDDRRFSDGEIYSVTLIANVYLYIM